MYLSYGPQLRSKFFQAVMTAIGICQGIAAANHTATSSQIEQYERTLLIANAHYAGGIQTDLENLQVVLHWEILGLCSTWLGPVPVHFPCRHRGQRLACRKRLMKQIPSSSHELTSYNISKICLIVMQDIGRRHGKHYGRSNQDTNGYFTKL